MDDKGDDNERKENYMVAIGITWSCVLWKLCFENYYYVKIVFWNGRTGYWGNLKPFEGVEIQANRRFQFRYISLNSVFKNVIISFLNSLKQKCPVFKMKNTLYGLRAHRIQTFLGPIEIPSPPLETRIQLRISRKITQGEYV